MIKIKLADWSSIAFLDSVYYLFDERTGTIDRVVTKEAKSICEKLDSLDKWIEITESEEKYIGKLIEKEYIIKEVM